MKKKVFHPFDPHKYALTSIIDILVDYPSTQPHLRRLIHRPSPVFPATSTRSSSYRRRDRAGLDTTVDIPRRAPHLDHLS